MGQIERHFSWLSFPMLNGATQSTTLPIRGFSMGMAELPAGLQGNLFFRTKWAKTGTESKVYDDGNPATAIVQGVQGLTKPLQMAIRPEVMTGAYLRFVATSAQTADKVIRVLAKG